MLLKLNQTKPYPIANIILSSYENIQETMSKSRINKVVLIKIWLNLFTIFKAEFVYRDGERKYPKINNSRTKEVIKM